VRTRATRESQSNQPQKQKLSNANEVTPKRNTASRHGSIDVDELRKQSTPTIHENAKSLFTKLNCINTILIADILDRKSSRRCSADTAKTPKTPESTQPSKISGHWRWVDAGISNTRLRRTDHQSVRKGHVVIKVYLHYHSNTMAHV
jgi:hypothetical protein